MKKNTNNRGCDFGKYNGLLYRVCYGLTEGRKMDYSTPHYEFHKYCNCEVCNKRFKYHEGLRNDLTVTTDDKEKFPEMERVVNNYSCGESRYIGRKYISFIDGEIKEKVV